MLISNNEFNITIEFTCPVQSFEKKALLDLVNESFNTYLSSVHPGRRCVSKTGVYLDILIADDGKSISIDAEIVRELTVSNLLFSTLSMPSLGLIPFKGPKPENIEIFLAETLSVYFDQNYTQETLPENVFLELSKA